jgi:hypothetical protein
LNPAWFNADLAVLLCSDCADLHRRLLPPGLTQVKSASQLAGSSPIAAALGTE